MRLGKTKNLIAIEWHFEVMPQLVNGLSGGAPYTINTGACLQNGDCSSPIFGQAFTLPDGV